MSKLFKLKNWLTIDDAAKHLSGVFSEAVNVSDVLRLALDGHLQLSVNFVNGVDVKVGRIVPVARARRTDNVGKLVSNVPDSHSCFQGFMLNAEEVIEFDGRTERFQGVFDLPLLGGERLDVEQLYQMSTGGPGIDLQEPFGTFILDAKGHYCQIQKHMIDFDSPKPYTPTPGSKYLFLNPELEESQQWSGQKRRSVYHEVLAAQSKTDYHYPAPWLPGDSVLVVRPDSIAQLIQFVNGKPLTLDRPLGTTERGHLLRLVIGMAIDGYGYVPGLAKSGVPKELEGVLASLGMSITDDTVRKYLKEARETVLPAKPRQA